MPLPTDDLRGTYAGPLILVVDHSPLHSQRFLTLTSLTAIIILVSNHDFRIFDRCANPASIFEHPLLMIVSTVRCTGTWRSTRAERQSETDSFFCTENRREEGAAVGESAARHP